MLKFISLSLITSCLISITIPLMASSNNAKVVPIKNTKLIKKAKKSPLTGTFEKQGGYYYLTLNSDQLTRDLYPDLTNNLSQKAQECLYRSQNDVGDHITIFYKTDDLTAQQQQAIDRLIGKTYTIHLENLEKVSFSKIYHRTSINEDVYCLRAKVPELYSILNKIKPNDYFLQRLHLTLAFAKHSVKNPFMCVR